MRAAVIRGAGDVGVEEVPDARVLMPTDAVVRVERASICGSDLWPYRGMPRNEAGERIGHEFVGVVEEVGRDVATVRPGDFVLAPMAYADNTCELCRRGLHPCCPSGGLWARDGVDGGQGEAVRVPLADGTLVPVAASVDEELLASLLTLTDVFATGHHSASTAGVAPGSTVAVVGDGAVGLCGVLAAHRMGAERVILLGGHEPRVAVGRMFGATDVVPARGEEAVEQVRALTQGRGADAVLECVGTLDAFRTGIAVCAPGGRLSRVGVPQYADAPLGIDVFVRNVTVTGGAAPARFYLPQLLPEVLAGDLRPGAVFDGVVDLADVAEGYRAMDRRTAIKVMVRP